MPDPEAGVTHHIVLEDTDGTKLGLISADKMISFTREPLARTSIKTSEGQTLYSDLELPYHSEMQEDFSGGRAQRHLRDDKTKFYDSESVDTRFKGQCILGPKIDTSTLANVGMPENNPGDVDTTVFPYSRTSQGTKTNYKYLSDSISPWKFSQSFTTPGIIPTITLTDITVNIINWVNNATYKITLCNDSSGEPGTTVSSTTSSALSTGDQDVTLAFTDALTLSTTYWIVFEIASLADRVFLYGSPGAKYADGSAMKYDGAWKDMEATWDFYFIVNYAQYRRSMSFNHTGSGTYAVTSVKLWMRKSGVVAPIVRIETDSSSKPSGTLAHAYATKTLANSDVSMVYGWVDVEFTSFNLTKGTTYHIVVTESAQLAYDTYWTAWGYDLVASGGGGCQKIGGTAWAADATKDFYYRINNGQGLDEDCLFLFTYGGILYAVDGPREGTGASKLWRNGEYGACDANTGALTTLIDGTKSWTTNEWADCIVKIVYGVGLGEYRTVLSNTGDTLTVDTAWTTEHTTASVYAIFGSSSWTDVTPGAGDTIDATVTAAIAANGIVYLAQGDDQNILRYREYNNAGTWTTVNADDSTNKATLLMEHDQKIWRANLGFEVSYSDVKAWGTDLSFGSAIEVGRKDDKVTSFVPYDHDVWVGKTESLWAIKHDIPEEVLQFRALVNDDNCVGMAKSNVYLFFPFGSGLERLYGLQVDDVGPNRYEGLPDGRQGPVSALLATPGMLYAAIDGGDSGRSCILAYNDLGWHEMVRGPILGDRITCMLQQVIPGGPNRLWFGHGNDVYHIKMPAGTINPMRDSDYEFADSGSLITSWIDLSLVEVDKYFKDLKLVTENLTTGVTITAFYQLDDSDDDDDWIYIGEYDTSAAQEMGVGNFITGRRIRFKFVLSTNSVSVTPNVLAWVLDSLSRVQPKYRWTPLINLEDDAQQLNGGNNQHSRADTIDQLDTWAGSATPLTMTTCDPAFTDITVLVEPLVETRKSYSKGEGGAGQMENAQGQVAILQA